MKKTVVVLYSKNHFDQLALALQQEYQKHINDVNLIIIDEDKYSNWGWSKFEEWVYRFTVRNMPWFNQFMGYCRRTFNVKMKEKKEKKKANKIAKSNTGKTVKDETDKNSKDDFITTYKKKMRKVDNIILRFNPDIIVCTTVKGLTKTLLAKERLDSKVFVCAAMTDYCTDRVFNNPRTDMYLVQNNSIKQTLITLGVNEEKISILGTPMVNEVKEVYDRKELLAEFGIENEALPIVTLVAGRCGGGKMKNAFKDLAQYSGNMNLICLTNKSENLKTFITQFCKSAGIDHNIICVDEVSNMAKIYSITDILVSAPTASITYEAISRNIPVVLMKNTNYIELGNSSYLTANGYAMRGEKTSHLVPNVLSCINKTEEYKQFIADLNGVFPQDSATKYAEFLNDILEKNREVEQVVMELEDAPVQTVVDEPKEVEEVKETKKRKK